MEEEEDDGVPDVDVSEEELEPMFDVGEPSKEQHSRSSDTPDDDDDASLPIRDSSTKKDT